MQICAKSDFFPKKGAKKWAMLHKSNIARANFCNKGTIG